MSLGLGEIFYMTGEALDQQLALKAIKTRLGRKSFAPNLNIFGTRALMVFTWLRWLRICRRWLLVEYKNSLELSRPTLEKILQAVSCSGHS